MSTFTNYVEAKNKNLKELSNEEIYYLLLEFVKEAAASKPKNDSKRKVYYISAEFLIGKLLSNNLINLGMKQAKTGYPAKHLANGLRYIMNPEKTEHGRYVCGHNCIPEQDSACAYMIL